MGLCTADMTQLVTWKHESCGDLTKVCHHLKTVYGSNKVFHIHICFGMEDSLNVCDASGVGGKFESSFALSLYYLPCLLDYIIIITCFFVFE